MIPTEYVLLAQECMREIHKLQNIRKPEVALLVHRQESITKSLYFMHDCVLGLSVNRFGMNQLNPTGFNVPYKENSCFFSCAGNWKSKNKYGGGRFTADNIHFQFSQ